MPWHLKADLLWFKEKTTEKSNSAVIMGRKTWESIPELFRPLKDRVNVVVSSQNNLSLPSSSENASSPETIIQKSSLTEALEYCIKHSQKAFIIGGASIYRQAVLLSGFETLWLTKINQEFTCDTFFPEIKNFEKKEVVKSGKESALSYSIEMWKRKI